MATLVKQKHLNLYKRYTEQLITDLGTPVKLIFEESVEKCPNCEYDPVHKASSGRYNGTGPKQFSGGICPVCNGDGKIYTEVEKNLNCTVNWGKLNENKEFVAKSAGTEEYNYFQIKDLVSKYDDIKSAKYLIVDGVRAELLNIIKRGLKDNVVCVALCKRVD